MVEDVNVCLPLSAYDEGSFKAARSLIEQANTIVISGHTNPDGDALGSGLALQCCLSELYPNKKAIHVLADDTLVDHHYMFLPGLNQSLSARSYTGALDLFISVDTPNPSRLADAELLFKRASTTLAFDHHPDMIPFGTVSIKQDNQAAVGCIIWQFAQFLSYSPSPEFATNILCAVMTDTGRFQYQNADRSAFYTAGDMVSYGANPSAIAQEVYQSKSLNFLRLLAIVTDRITTYEQGRISYSFVLNEDFKSTGARRDECDGLIDSVRCVEHSEICLFLRQEPYGNKVRGNLRSKTSADIGSVARKMGGGGHRAAAGFTAEGTPQEVFDKIYPLLKEALYA